MGTLRLDTTLQPRGPAAAIVLTDEQAAVIGEGAKAFPVVASIGGKTVRGRVSRMGGEYLFGFSRAAREAAGLEIGADVSVEISLDTAPREVDVPPALAAALDGDEAARAAFEGLAYTHRKEFARWIAEAKRDETRDRRVAQALEMLHKGRTRS
jgi:hypothetical protein